jgi:CheY-like chemotaxis protein
MRCPDVVVVEDDPDIRDVIREVLVSEGYVVHAFANGREALDGLKCCPEPCLILLDLMMPVMSGQEFLEARHTVGDRLMAVLVLIVSAFADPAQRADGVIGYVKKPVDVDLLLRMIGRYCEGASSEGAA